MHHRGPLRWRHTLRARLLAGFLSVVAVFALASLLSNLSRRELQRAVDQTRYHADGIHAALNMANAAREAYVHVAHVIIDHHGLEHASHVEDALRGLDHWKGVVSGKLSTEEERASFRLLEAEATRFRTIYEAEIIPAARAGDEDRLHRAHDELEKCVTKLIAANDSISDRFTSRISAEFVRANDLSSRAMKRDLFLLGAATLLALVLSLLTARGVVRPMNDLLDATRRISRGELGYEARVHDRGELGALGAGLDAMSRELRERKDAAVQAEKLASIGRIAAGVAHELNNPLGVILGYVVTMRREATAASQQEDDLATIEGEVRQCQRIVEGLLELARPIAVDRDLVDLTELARAELGRLDGTVLSKIEIDDKLPETLAAHGDAGRLRQVLANLLRNAAEAMVDGGVLSLRIGVPARQGAVALEVADTGPGIPPENLASIFEPFFTTKKRGIGLGLSISYAIVRALGGELRVTSRPGEGARFTLELPDAGAPSASMDAA